MSVFMFMFMTMMMMVTVLLLGWQVVLDFVFLGV